MAKCKIFQNKRLDFQESAFNILQFRIKTFITSSAYIIHKRIKFSNLKCNYQSYKTILSELINNCHYKKLKNKLINNYKKFELHYAIIS